MVVVVVAAVVAGSGGEVAAAAATATGGEVAAAAAAEIEIAETGTARARARVAAGRLGACPRSPEPPVRGEDGASVAVRRHALGASRPWQLRAGTAIYMIVMHTIIQLHTSYYLIIGRLIHMIFEINEHSILINRESL